MTQKVIKFKAYDTHRKKMWSAAELGADELTINPDGRGFVNVNSTSSRLSQYMPHLIPLQYTGFHDKYSKELYVGEILRNDNYPEGLDTVIVEFEGAYRLKDFDGNIGEYLSEVNEVSECIGNIYEHPDLLFKKNDEKNPLEG